MKRDRVRWWEWVLLAVLAIAVLAFALWWPIPTDIPTGPPPR
jgi:hypothetical protein